MGVLRCTHDCAVRWGRQGCVQDALRAAVPFLAHRGRVRRGCGPCRPRPAVLTWHAHPEHAAVDVQVRNGDGDTSPKCKLFRGLPRGFTLFPCLSMCNAGQVIFMKYGE